MSKIAFIFPGQGAQKIGMGKDFYEQYEEAQKVFDEANEILDIDVKALCFEENDLLNLTQYTQAAMVTTSLAMVEVLRAKGVVPDIAAGLSLGEYCAIATAGAMSIRDAIVTVRKRGILMEQAVPAGQGGMAAVLGMDAAAIEAVVNPIEGVSIANYNCPGQIVITGKKEALEKASEELKAAGAKRVIELVVSGPFHSGMLTQAGEELYKELEKVELGALRIPYVTNVTAKKVTDTAEIKELLAKQISSSVRWQQSVEEMIADGVDTFIEIGPGKTLSGFLRKTSRDVTVKNVETVEDLNKLLQE